MTVDQMKGVIDFLYDWQTLIGAVAGGLVALLAALIVAYKAERRSDLAAAMHVVSTLVAIRAAGNQLGKIAAERGITDPDERAAWQAEKLVWHRPKLSPLFEASIARIMPLDVTAAAHLQFFHSQYIDLEDKLRRLESDIAEFQQIKKAKRDKNYMMIDAKSATRTFNGLVIHADCGLHLLTKFVLSRSAYWNRLWCRWFPDQKTKHCREILRNPQSPEETVVVERSMSDQDGDFRT